MICRHAGVKTGEITDIRGNPLLKSAWGRCITDRINGTHKIEINEALLDDSVPDLSLKRTIIHELCHTVKDGHGHRKGWREAADRLEKVYGLQLSPANSAEELCVPDSISQASVIRYVFRCTDCGLVIERCRRSKFVDNPERYRCGNCGGTLERMVTVQELAKSETQRGMASIVLGYANYPHPKARKRRVPGSL